MAKHKDDHPDETPPPPKEATILEKASWLWAHRDQELGISRTSSDAVRVIFDDYIRNIREGRSKGGEAPKRRKWISQAMRECYDGKMTREELWDVMREYSSHRPWEPENADVQVYVDGDTIVQTVNTGSGEKSQSITKDTF